MVRVAPRHGRWDGGRPLISVRVMGGLGNQLFQVSAMLHAQQHLGVRARCETSWFGSDEVRTPRTFDAARVLAPSERYRLPRPLARAVYSPRNPLLVAEAAVGDDVLARVRHGWAWTSAYFQRAEHPLAVRDELATRFGRAFGGLPRPRSPDDAIGVHVRLGDYATDPLATAMMGLTDPAYFVDAVADLRTEMGDRPVRVFTDSPDLVRDHLVGVGDPVELADAGDPWVGMRDLASCAAIVASNSTFSWWAAFVATVIDGRSIPVVMPEPWFATPSPADRLLRIPGWRARARAVGS